MQLPSAPKKGEKIIAFCNAILSWARANQILSVTGGRLKRTANGVMIDVTPSGGSRSAIELITSFKLSTSTIDDEINWRVSSVKSIITDGINGDSIDLGASGSAWSATDPIKFDTDTEITETKYIVLQADVDADYIVTDWTLAAVASTDIEEVRFNGTTYEQDKLRLLIGKVTIDDGDASVIQAVASPQMIVFGLLNGRAVKVMIESRTPPDQL